MKKLFVSQMHVCVWISCFVLQVQLVVFIKGGNSGKRHHRSSDDNTKDTRDNNNAPQSHNRSPVDFLANPKPVNEKDYFLPLVFSNTNDDGADEDEEDDPYVDYDYETKELNYKDSPDSQTVLPEAGEQDVIGLGERIPLHTAKDNLPMFLLEPENTYVVKTKPATLKCRAANTLEVYFKCNGVKTHALNFEFVDPHTGVRIIEGEYNVTREQVEEYFGTDKFQCSCFAWTSRGHIRSQAAFIEIAYIKKQFTQSPQSQLVKQNTQATFRCEAPAAAPFAQLYWLKNGAPLVTNDNVQATRDGSLLIKQASLLDMANYTCVAENLVGKRLSEPALLTVFVNGGWTAWSSWVDCTCEGARGSGRRRVRTCSAPRPLNGGQPCVGPAVQRSKDCLECDLDLYSDVDELADESPDILLGHWSQWSEWSRCDADCLQTRRRRCLSSIACLGKDYQVAQCPLCVRSSQSHLIGDASSYWPLFLLLLIAFLIMIVISVLGVKYIKMKMSEPYVKSHPGSNFIGKVIKRTLTNQPDLTIHEEFHTIDSSRTQRQMGHSVYNRNEHLYEVPQLASSYISPIDQEVRAAKPTDRSYACKDESERSDSSCFLSSGSSYGHESLELSPSLKNNLSVDSKFVPTNLETSISRMVTSEGGWLTLARCGATMFVPDGAIEKEELFSFEVTDDEWYRPTLREDETQLSPIIRCGPKSAHFRKSVVLTFSHCAALTGDWLISILQKPEEINTREWRTILTIGQETPGSPVFAQMDPGKIYILSEFLSDFVVVGRSFSGLDSKLFKIVLFLTKKIIEDSYCCILKAHVVNDTAYALYECIENEKRMGGTLLCDSKSISFQENCSNLCFVLKGVGVGWKATSEKYQEVSYKQVWNKNSSPLHCDFALQQIDSINALEFNLSVYQKQKLTNSVNFNLKSNDFNCNLNSNPKRLSSSSMDTGKSVNILQNPFYYSSLSRREDIYDNVYKNCNNLFRSKLSLDNNYKCNVLTKSDRVILCKLLDVVSPKGNDWRMFAEKLSIDSYYYYFSNTCSPTENILNLWLCRCSNEANKLLNLARVFREMSRIDCSTVVERRCFPN